MGPLSWGIKVPSGSGSAWWEQIILQGRYSRTHWPFLHLLLTDSQNILLDRFVNVHLTAHAQNLNRRLQDYKHIVQTLLFKPVPRSLSKISPTATTYSTIYDTTHLFFFGDLNFRLTPIKPSSSTDISSLSTVAAQFPSLPELLKSNGSLDGRRELVKYDQLRNAMWEERVCAGLKEGETAQFPCTYKYVIGCVDEYRCVSLTFKPFVFLCLWTDTKLCACSVKRTPSWTDRILYTTALDEPSSPTKSSIQNVLYTSILAFTKSDHKPITALLLLPPSSKTSLLSKSAAHTPLVASPPIRLRLTPDRYRHLFARLLGKSLDRIVGSIWCLLWLLGVGNAGIGIFSVLLGTLGFLYWRQM